MAQNARNIAVIGLGTFGSTVARNLQKFGNDITGIDIAERNVTPLVDELTQSLILDARDPDALREAGVDAADVGLIAIGTNIEASALATINLKTLGVKTIWAKATTRNHHRILSKLGVDRVIHPEREVGQHIAEILNNPLVRDYVSLGNGQNVVNFRVPESLQGKTLSEIAFTETHDLRCIGVLRGTKYLGHDGEDCTLEADDMLLLLGTRKALRDYAAGL